MTKTRIAAALAVIVLTSCSVEEPEQSLPVVHPPPADKQEEVDRQGSDDFPKIPVTTAGNGAAENAGLRADSNAP